MIFLSITLGIYILIGILLSLIACPLLINAAYEKQWPAIWFFISIISVIVAWPVYIYPSDKID